VAATRTCSTVPTAHSLAIASAGSAGLG
jgi:hypothetical protein